MFGIGMTELLVILVVALLLVGPKRLPELARSLGRAMGEFRRASNDLRQQLNEAVEEAQPEPERPADSELPRPEPDSLPEPQSAAEEAAKPSSASRG